MYQLPAPRPTFQQRLLSIWQRAMQRFVWLVKDSEIEFAEVQSALALILWGFWLWNPYWQTFASSKSFDAMAYIAPETIWGAAVLVSGTIQIAAFVGEHKRVRIAACVGGIFLWATITFMFAQANIASTGTPAYALFTLNNLWALLRLARGNG